MKESKNIQLSETWPETASKWEKVGGESAEKQQHEDQPKTQHPQAESEPNSGSSFPYSKPMNWAKVGQRNTQHGDPDSRSEFTPVTKPDVKKVGEPDLATYSQSPSDNQNDDPRPSNQTGPARNITNNAPSQTTWPPSPTRNHQTTCTSEGKDNTVGNFKKPSHKNTHRAHNPTNPESSQDAPSNAAAIQPSRLPSTSDQRGPGQTDSDEHDPLGFGGKPAIPRSPDQEARETADGGVINYPKRTPRQQSGPLPKQPAQVSFKATISAAPPLSPTQGNGAALPPPPPPHPASGDVSSSSSSSSSSYFPPAEADSAAASEKARHVATTATATTTGKGKSYLPVRLKKQNSRRRNSTSPLPVENETVRGEDQLFDSAAQSSSESLTGGEDEESENIVSPKMPPGEKGQALPVFNSYYPHSWCQVNGFETWSDD